MEVLSVKNLGFTYKNSKFTLDDISFTLKKGELKLICGPCGCGKSTLLRLFKKEICPSGNIYGDIGYPGKAPVLGYLSQNTEASLVCDRVLDEIVFGAENMGMKPGKIGRLLAETTAYLGIEDILDKNCQELSGGQKQLVALASVLMMEPDILLLDEPTSQLDPVSTYDFVRLLVKLKDELGIAVLVAEHNLDAMLGVSDSVIYMEDGRIRIDGTRDELVKMLMKNKRPFAASIPETIKYAVSENLVCEGFPYTIRELYGLKASADSVRRAETERDSTEKPEELKKQRDSTEKPEESKTDRNSVEKPEESKTETVVEVKKAWFRYEKKSEDVIKDLSLELRKGKIYGIIGGNGAGKSTIISLISGYRKPYRGKVKRNIDFGYLPQNPAYCFFKDVLLEDYELTAEKEEIEKLCSEYELFRNISGWFDKNPQDLSGGQQQIAAIAKLLLVNSDGLVMDEPVKGLDGSEKTALGELMRTLADRGKTVVFVSHDLEFVEDYADYCLMMFDGKIAVEDKPEALFKGNRFYTTVRGRMEE